MSKHLFGMILTHQGTYANNRGDTEGNATTLQKVLRNGDLFTTVSADAIRYAIREGWQAKKDKEMRLNRHLINQRELEFQDRTFNSWCENLDDDALGFMLPGENTLSRRGVLEITRAISTTPWRGEIMQNYASPGSNPSQTHGNPIPYAVEVHDTRYQFGFALTPEFFGRDGINAPDSLDAEKKKLRLRWVLEGLINLRRVGGNHARYFTDFSPEAIILRWTDDPAPRFLYCFLQDEHGALSLKNLLGRLSSDGDIEPCELIIGTAIEIPELEDKLFKDATIKTSIKGAIEYLLNRVTDQDLCPGD